MTDVFSMPIEVKHAREEEVDDDRKVKRRLLLKERTDEWYQQIFSMYSNIYTMILARSPHRQSITGIGSASTLQAMVEDATELGVMDTVEMVLQDFFYLIPFSSVTRIAFKEGSRQWPNEPPSFFLHGLHLDDTRITSFIFNNTSRPIRGMSEPFERSLRKMVHLRLHCQVLLEDRDTPLFKVMPLLKHLQIGTNNVEATSEELRRVQSKIGKGWFEQLESLKELEVVNVTTDSLQFIPTNVHLESITIELCDLKSVPQEWNVLKNIKSISFKNTAFEDFDVVQFHPFYTLEHLSFSNEMYNDDESVDADIPKNTFVTVQLYDMLNLVSITIDGIVLMNFFLGRNIREGDSFLFPKLRTIVIDPGVTIELLPANRRNVSTFLPVLARVDLAVDDRWPEEDDDDGWYEQNNVVFPLFLLNLHTIENYTGPFTLPETPRQLDSYLMPIQLINLFRARGGYYRMIWGIVRLNGPEERLTARSRDVQLLIDEMYTRWEVERIANEEVREEEREQRRLQQRPEEQHILDQREREAQATVRVRGVRETPGSGRIRKDPYFVKWKGQPCSGSVTDNPFAEDAKGIPLHSCPLCVEAFTKSYHDAEKKKDVNNNDFMTGAARQAIIDAYANHPMESYDGAGYGCVVVCNLTTSDFEKNQMPIPSGQTKEKAVTAFQCQHSNHFFHRVCYSKFLIEWREERGWTQCPSTDIRFFPSNQE